MAFVGKAVTKLAKVGLFGVAGLVASHKKPKLPAPLPSATRDDAAAMVAQEDELRRRKGGAADIITGTGGAEAALSGGKLVLGN